MKRIWDKLGICASGLCLVHCIATPVILILFPTIKVAFIGHEQFHQIFGVIVVSSVMAAVYPQCHRHGHKDIIAFAMVGVTFILAGIFLGHDLGQPYEHLLTITGSLFLITAHLKNMRIRHGKCESTCSTPHLSQNAKS